MASAAQLTSPAVEQFRQGLRAYSEAFAHAKMAKVRALDAGRHWRAAQSMARHGEFGELLASHNVAARTVYLTIEFLSVAEQWLQALDPTLSGERLDRAVNDAVLTSPKPFTALLRDWKIVEPVGAYDPVAYRERKELPPVQIEFHFEPFTEQLEALCAAPISLAASSLQTLETKLEQALQRVRELRAVNQTTGEQER